MSQFAHMAKTNRKDLLSHWRTVNQSMLRHTPACLLRPIKKRGRETQSNLSQNWDSPIKHASWSSCRHNWRSWIPQLTDLGAALRGLVTVIKCSQREICCVLIHCESTCSVAFLFCSDIVKKCHGNPTIWLSLSEPPAKQQQQNFELLKILSVLLSIGEQTFSL